MKDSINETSNKLLKNYEKEKQNGTKRQIRCHEWKRIH